MSKINFQFQGHKFFEPMERKPVSKSIKFLLEAWKASTNSFRAWEEIKPTILLSTRNIR